MVVVETDKAIGDVQDGGTARQSILSVFENKSYGFIFIELAQHTLTLRCHLSTRFSYLNVAPTGLGG
jgi:hypothetical protein